MESIIKKILTYAVLPAAIVVLAYYNVMTITAPLRFEEARAAREAVAVQRLEDIRELQKSYIAIYGEYASSIDTLKKFYNEGMRPVPIRIGDEDDSISVAHTTVVKEKIQKSGALNKYPKAKRDSVLARMLYERYKKGDTELVFEVDSIVPIRKVLFTDRSGFCVDSLAFIPFSGGDSIQMQAGELVGEYSTTAVFEVKMPYKSLLKGLDKQLCVNLIAERDSAKRYPGLKLGDLERADITGNWE